MTRNQIEYWNLQELKRSNAAREAETQRANIAKEQETNRSNLAKEQETYRSNKAKEVDADLNRELEAASTIAKTLTGTLSSVAKLVPNY